MPCKKDQLVMDEGKNTTQEFITREIDQLVSEMKENLRVKTRLNVASRNRVSPYQLPCKWQRKLKSKECDCTSPKCLCHIKKPDSMDAYELLQQLLREGRLIQEAVKRLHIGLTTTTKHTFVYDDTDTVESKHTIVFN